MSNNAGSQDREMPQDPDEYAVPDLFDGAQFVHFLKGPATLALAVPLYPQLGKLRRAVIPVIGALGRLSRTGLPV